MKKQITTLLITICLFGILSAQGTPGLSYTLIDGNTAYSVSRGTVTATHIEIPTIYNDRPVTMIRNNGFSNYTTMTSITIPNSITSIGSEAFNGCSSLTSIDIPSSVTSIGNAAFRHCTSLTSIVIPNSVTSIGNNAFVGCTSLTSADIPDSVTSIGSSAFDGCTSLTSIVIGNSVTTIVGNPFAYTPNLETFIVASGNTSFRGLGNSLVTNTGNTIISGTKNSVIPSSVTSIGPDAFRGCTSLTSIVIPSSVTSIGNYAFRGCTSLTSIVIPSSVTSIGNYAFSGCTSLTIYAEALSRPAGWNTNWNPSNCPVIWGSFFLPPIDLVVVLGIGGVNLSWLAPDIQETSFLSVSAYSIGRRIAEDEWVIVAHHTSTSWIDTAVIAGITYEYRVIARYPHGYESVPSNTATIDIRLVMNPPQNFIATMGDQQVDLTWDEPATGSTGTLSGYKIFRRTSTSATNLVDVIFETTYSDTHLTNGNDYYYQIVASYTNLNGDSERVSALPFPVTPYVYKPPLNLSATTGNGQVTLLWTAPEPGGATLDGYKIYRGTTQTELDSIYTITANLTNAMDQIDNIGLTHGSSYFYAVKASYSTPISGDSEYSNIVSSGIVSEGDDTTLPTVTKLGGNYPNPFNPSTTITFSISRSALSLAHGVNLWLANESDNVTIDIFNIRGQRVRTLINGTYTAGTHKVVWNGTDDAGRNVSSGIYFYRMTTDGYSAVKRMVLMK